MEQKRMQRIPFFEKEEVFRELLKGESVSVKIRAMNLGYHRGEIVSGGFNLAGKPSLAPLAGSRTFLEIACDPVHEEDGIILKVRLFSMNGVYYFQER